MSAPHCNVVVTRQTAPKQVSFTLKQVLQNVVTTVKIWQSRANQRHKLRISLEDEDFLKDIGISLWDAKAEASKPFWK